VKIQQSTGSGNVTINWGEGVQKQQWQGNRTAKRQQIRNSKFKDNL